jgi:phosphohistidine phosphatase
VRTRPRWFYVQSAVVPYRVAGGSTEVLLITTRGGRRWTVPKGVVEPRMTAAASAAKEAYEEAGVRGDVEAAPLGAYEYEKWGGTCTVEVYAMRVTEVLDAWPESHRRRRWVPLDDAPDAVEADGVQRVLAALAERLRGDAEPRP